MTLSGTSKKVALGRYKRAGILPRIRSGYCIDATNILKLRRCWASEGLLAVRPGPKKNFTRKFTAMRVTGLVHIRRLRGLKTSGQTCHSSANMTPLHITKTLY